MNKKRESSLLQEEKPMKESRTDKGELNHLVSWEGPLLWTSKQKVPDDARVPAMPNEANKLNCKKTERWSLDSYLKIRGDILTEKL